MNNDEFEEKEVTLQDYIGIILAYRNFIIISILVTVFAILFVTLRRPKIYEAKALLRLSVSQAKLNVIPQSQMWWGLNLAKGELEILQSKSLKARVVMDLGLNIRFKNKNFHKVFKVDSARTFYPCEFKKYLLEISDHEVKVKDNGKLIAAGRLGELIRGPGFEFRILPKNKEPDKPFIDTIEIVDPRESIGKISIRASIIEETNIARIRAYATDPKLAAKLANTLAREYILYTLSGLREEAHSMRSFIEEQLVTVEKELKEAELALKNFKEKENVYEISTTLSVLTSQLTELEGEKAKAVAEKEETQVLLEHYTEELKGQGFYGEYKKAMSLPDISSNPTIQQLKAQITQLEIKRAQLLAQYGAQHPHVMALNKAIAQTKEELQKAIKSVLTVGPSASDPIYQNLISNIVDAEAKVHALEGKIKALDLLIAQYKRKLKRLPEKEVRLAELQRRVKVAQEVYSMLLDKLQEAKIAEAGKVSDAKLIDPAYPPKKPIKPRPKQALIIALFIGLVVGIGGAFLLDYLDTTVKTAEEVERILGAPVLGSIPFVRTEEAGKEEILELEKRLITHFDPKSPVSEAYRALRANIKFASVGEVPKFLVVSSSVAKEGKTSTAINLAISLAHFEQKVLLVDADLRNPVINKIFGVSREPGLSDVIVGREKVENAVYEVDDIPNLYILPSGPIPPNPAELLGSSRMDTIMKEMASLYDMIIFDSAPLLPAADTVELSKKAGNLLLVVRAGSTERAYLEETKRLLENVQIKVLGAVLNAIDIERRYSYYRYRYYHYRYYHYRYSYGYPSVGKKTLFDRFTGAIKKITRVITRFFTR